LWAIANDYAPQMIVKTPSPWHACSSGSDDMAKAFMAGGARHFIAPTGYPDGSDALKMICDFLYFYGVKEKAPVEALSLAKIESNDSCMFKLWECNN